MLIFFTAISCNSNNTPSIGGIKISINDGISRGIEPNISLDVFRYSLSFAGPDGQAFGDYISARNPSYTKTDLLPGEWRIKAVALNESDQKIGICETSVTVTPGETKTVSMNVEEFAGNGTFTVNLTAPPSAEYTAVISKVTDGSLTEYKSENMVVQENGSYSASFSLMNGYYTLSFKSDNHAVSLPAPVAFRIVKGDTLNASFMAETINIVSFYSGNRLIETRNYTPDIEEPFPEIVLGEGFTLDGWKAEGVIDTLIRDESFSLPYSETEYKYYAYISTDLLRIDDTGAVYGTDVLKNSEGTTTITIPDSINGISVKKIGEQAFCGYNTLNSINMPDTIERIEDKAFEDCTGLSEIIIPDSVTSIGKSAFFGCSSLTNINIGKSVETIEFGAFVACNNLTKVIIPDSVTSIQGFAFNSCANLTDIKIGNSVSKIYYYAFGGCTELTKINIPDSVILIEPGAFASCSKLSVINVSENNPFYKSIDGILFSKNGKNLECFPAGKTDTNYIIPNTVTTIRGISFTSCSNITDITIGDSVTTIEWGAFQNCKNLKNVTIGNSVTTLSDGLFSKCSSLTNILLGNKVTSIQDGAFSYCSSLTNIIIPKSVTNIAYDAFEGCSSLTCITIKQNQQTTSLTRAPWGAPSSTEVKWQGEF